MPEQTKTDPNAATFLPSGEYLIPKGWRRLKVGTEIVKGDMILDSGVKNHESGVIDKYHNIVPCGNRVVSAVVIRREPTFNDTCKKFGWVLLYFVGCGGLAITLILLLGRIFPG